MVEEKKEEVEKKEEKVGRDFIQEKIAIEEQVIEELIVSNPEDDIDKTISNMVRLS